MSRNTVSFSKLKEFVRSVNKVLKQIHYSLSQLMARLLYFQLKYGEEIDAKKIEINSKLKTRENNSKAKVGQVKVYSGIDV